MRLWLNSNEFMEIDTSDRGRLTEEIATRAAASGQWPGFDYWLPDPDPVLRRLGQDATVYRDLLSDAHVWSCYDSRKSGALGCAWELREAEGGSGAANRRALDLAQEMMAALPVRQIITEMLDAPFFGFTPIEVIWRADGGRWLPSSLTGKPFEWFTFDDENRLRFKASGIPEGDPVPAGKFLLARHHASYQNPYGERVLSRCFWPVTFKRGGFKFWAIFTEKFGMPWVRGKVPPGTNETERQRLLDRLTAMVQDAVAVINNDESVEITESAGKKASADIYEALINAGNGEVSKAIVGHSLATESKEGGTYGATRAGLEVRDDLVEKDKGMVADTWNTLFAWVTALNVPGATAPRFVWQEEEEARKELAERDRALHQQGVRLKPVYYMRRYGLHEDEFSVVAGSPAAAGGQFAEAAETDPVDAMTDTLEAAAAAPLAAMIDAVRRLVASAGSLEDIRDELAALYPEASAADLAEAIGRALTVANLAGRSDILDGR